MKKILFTILISVCCQCLFSQATCPTKYNPVTVKTCFSDYVNFVKKITLQSTLVQKGSSTDSGTLTTAGLATSLTHGNGFLLVNNTKGVIGVNTSTGYRVAATATGIQLQQGSTDSVTQTFTGSGSTDTTKFVATTSQYYFSPALDANSVTGFWKLTGNASTNSSTNFVGTTDGQDLKFAANSYRTMTLGVDSSFTASDDISLATPNYLIYGGDLARIGVTGKGLATQGNKVFFTAVDTMGIGSDMGIVNIDADLVPSTNKTYDFGRSAAEWRLGWFQAVNIDSGLTINNGTQGNGKILVSNVNGVARWDSSAISTSAGDAATLNVTAGRFRKDTSGSTFTLTNSYITANSHIFLQVVTSGLTTGNEVVVSAGSGSATITFQTSLIGASAPSANADIEFFVIN